MKRPKAKGPCCGTCRYSRPLKDNDTAIQCQYEPPKITAVVGNTVTSHWPLLAKDQWCGKYKLGTVVVRDL